MGRTPFVAMNAWGVSGRAGKTVLQIPNLFFYWSRFAIEFPHKFSSDKKKCS